ncbi:MAG: hypothetical protein ACRYG2_27480 [Janthinobacterium lividum]
MSDLPSTSEPETTLPDDDGAALERAARSIREAHDAEGQVAANDDITSADEAKAGEHSEDPDGTGGHP